MKEFYNAVHVDKESIDVPSANREASKAAVIRIAVENRTRNLLNEGDESISDSMRSVSRWRRLLLLLLESEIANLTVWSSPLIVNDFNGKIQHGMTEVL